MERMRWETRLFSLALAVGAWGCAEERPPVACAAYAVAGLSVEVTDASGQPLCDAVVTAAEGAYSERLLETSCRFVGAYERPGDYLVHAERAGFVPKQVGAVRVVTGRGECPHVTEVRVTLALTPVG